MLTIALPPEIRQRIVAALAAAREREVGGVLMAEHTGANFFTVREITIHRRGALASFVRHLREAIGGIRLFFRTTGYEYTRFNYLGEWHSHPMFSTEPSSTDDASMREIVSDTAVGATFVVLLVLKLDSSMKLTGTAHTYLPDGSKHRSTLSL